MTKKHKKGAALSRNNCQNILREANKHQPRYLTASDAFVDRNRIDEGDRLYCTAPFERRFVAL